MLVYGKLIKVKREKKQFKKGSKEALFITLAEVDLDPVQMDELNNAFNESGDAFTPDWIKDFKGYVNVSTKFELPCMTLDNAQHDSIEKVIEDGLAWYEADVLMSLVVKDGAVYPKAVKFLTEGKAYNAFTEFEGVDDLPINK